MTRVINLQIASFAGLGLPRTLNKPVDASTSIADVVEGIFASLPSEDLRGKLLLTTLDGHRLLSTNREPISTFTSNDAAFLPLRLSARLCGGKGGFGSQLRAAGGRMSSRKKRDGQDVNGSNRNLDGRRLRTVNEAKRLAQYLEVKPEMEKQEKEERRKRWEAVIQAADENEEKIRSGRMGSNQGRLDGEYVESKALAEERVRDAITRAAKSGLFESGRTGSESSEADAQANDSQRNSGSEDASDDDHTTSNTRNKTTGPTFFGWDEEEEDDTDDSQEDEDDEAAIQDGIVAGDPQAIAQATTESQEQLQADLQAAARSAKGKQKAV